MDQNSLVALDRARLQLSIAYPDRATCAEVLRRRLIVLIAAAGHTISSAAALAGLHHHIVVRKLAAPERPASERRPLDEETIVRLLAAIARAPEALVSCDFEVGDETILQWLAERRAEARKAGNWLSAKKHSEPVSAAVALWPTDAAERIDRLVALGFVVRSEDGATLSITTTGSACAVR